MSKFYAYCHNKTLDDNNGGSLVLYHHLHALEQLGHNNGGLLNLVDEIPDDCDYIMCQGEWWDTVGKKINKSKAKSICWLGHFSHSNKYAMPNIQTIKADFYHTQYKGEAVEWAKKIIGKDIYYLPHAGCNLCNTEGIKKEGIPKAVIIRNKFNERDENWLDYAKVTAINTPFNEIKNIYKSSIVCPNLHGDFQKGIITEFFKIPAMMINERIFQIILSGGFAISDNNPIVKEFFSDEEVPYCETKEEYKDKINYFIQNPEKRIYYMKKAKERILKEHLYIHRWNNYLKELI